MSHTQFTQTERISLATLLRAGHIKADCARELSKDPSAVGREIKTNKDEDGVYRGAHAHKRAMARRKKAKRSARKIANNPRLQRYIIRKLKKHWSPEQIAGRLKQVNGDTQISHETIYLWIYNEQSKLKKYLRSKKGKYRRKRGTKVREDKRDRAKVKRIDERPPLVDLRTRIGDWEGDTVIGGEKTTRIATNVDRYSGYGLGDLMHVVSAVIMHKTLEKRFALIPHAKRHTYTYDNGTELGEDDTGLEEKLRMSVYRAYPYHSWERGTNENWNGLLREFFPKKMLFATLTQADVDRAVKLINHRPRKRLGYLTPYEVFVLGKVPAGRGK
jgi:IS30 family transposase